MSKLAQSLICVGVAVLIFTTVRCAQHSLKINTTCENHDGVLVRLHGVPDICIKKEAVITYE